MNTLSAPQSIEKNELKSNSEGAVHKQTLHGSAMLSGRAASTAIYCMPPQGQVPAWRRADDPQELRAFGAADLTAPPALNFGGFALAKRNFDPRNI